MSTTTVRPQQPQQFGSIFNISSSVTTPNTKVTRVGLQMVNIKSLFIWLIIKCCQLFLTCEDVSTHVISEWRRWILGNIAFYIWRQLPQNGWKNWDKRDNLVDSLRAASCDVNILPRQLISCVVILSDHHDHHIQIISQLHHHSLNTAASLQLNLLQPDSGREYYLRMSKARSHNVWNIILFWF